MRILPLCLALPCLLPAAALGQDSDGDGAPDATDARPCDPTIAGEAFAPAEGQSALLLFEDQWPSAGDADYNDAVVAHHFRLALDAAGRAVAVHARLDVLALGGVLDNGLGLHLPVPRQSVSAVRVSANGAPAVEVAPSMADAELTIRLASNLRALFGDQPDQINSRPDRPRQASGSLQVEVTFASPQALSPADAPFDLYLFRTADPSLEIHRLAYPGTAAMDPARFGAADDASGAGRWFVDTDGLPFALDVPQLAAHPSEATPLDALYPDVLGWAASGGTANQGWYLSTVVDAAAYRDADGQGAPTPAAPTTPSADTTCLPPGPVPDGMFFWVDGDDVDGDNVPEGANEGGLDSNGFVQIWRDKSGHGRHLTRFSSQNLARLVPNAWAGRAAPRFSTDSIYEHRTGQTLEDYTIFMVANRVTWAGGNRREILSTGEDRGRYPLDWAVQSGRVEHYRGSSASLVLRGPSTSDWAGMRKIAFTQDRLTGNSVLARFWEDGVETHRASGNWENLHDELWVGGKVQDGSPRNRWNGEIAEIIVYDRALAPAEIAAVESYLAGKWQLP